MMEFDQTGRRLFLGRVESRDGSGEPVFNRDPRNPNVFKVRDLLGKKPDEPFLVINRLSGDGPRGGLLPVLPLPRLPCLRQESRGADHSVSVHELPSGSTLWKVSLPPRSRQEEEPHLPLDSVGYVQGFAYRPSLRGPSFSP